MNNYGSLVDTFSAMDIYNLPLPVTPPANLTLARTAFTRRYFAGREGAAAPVTRFNVADKPFLKSIGIFSNLADGLVDAASSHRGQLNGLTVTLSLDRFFPALTGTITNDPGGMDPQGVVGTGTLFTREVCPGMRLVWRDDNDNIQTVEVGTVPDDVSLGISSPRSQGMYSGVAATNRPLWGLVQPQAGNSLTVSVPTLNQLYPYSFFLGDVSKVRPITGKLTFRAGSATVTGKNTRFTREIAAGQCIRYGTGAAMRTLLVASVESDVSLTVNVPGTGVAGVPTNAVDQEIGLLDNFLGLRGELSSGLEAYTITIDPAFGASSRRLAIHLVGEIEHSLAVDGTI